MRRSTILVSFLLLSACGGDDGPTAVADGELTGRWSYSANDLTGSGLSCDMSGVTATLNQTGATFTGTAQGGTVTCRMGSQSQQQALGTSNILNGQIAGSSVSFDIGTPDFHHTGTLDGSSMSGSVSFGFDFGAPFGVISLTGRWSAAKQP